MRIVFQIFCLVFSLGHELSLAAGPFVHPGLLHSAADLARMRDKVKAGEEPWLSGFQKLRDDPFSRLDGKLMDGPFEVVNRSRDKWTHNAEMVCDGNRVYQTALLWRVTGDKRYAEKAVRILNAWSTTLKRMEGNDVQLAAGLNGFKFVNAAELMRDTGVWPSNETAAAQAMFRNAVLPPIYDFATFANGNWDGACMKTMIAIGVFCDDRDLFDRAVRYYRHGKGNGRLTHYLVDADGQCQESGRDQQHTQLGLGLLAETCQIAWNQGVDLYADENNLLLAGFEYTARYNLGDDRVPFAAFTDTTGHYRHKKISEEGRGKLRNIYEMVWNHYGVLRGLPAPWTKKAAEKIRPEGVEPNGDHPGFGTLTFTLPPTRGHSQLAK